MLNKRYNTCLAAYFQSKPLYLDGTSMKKPNVRKQVEQPWQQTKGELWDEVTATLSNLDFIQAVAVAKMTYGLINDIRQVLELIPDNVSNIREGKVRQARLDKYTQDLIDCASGKIPIEDLEIIESITPWTEMQKKAVIKRIKTKPSHTDILNDFLHFLTDEVYNLQNYAREFKHFATQQAWNYAKDGPVGKAAEKRPAKILKTLIRHRLDYRPSWSTGTQVLYTHCINDDYFFSTIAVSANGRRAITGSWDMCTIWDLTSGQRLYKLTGHSDWVTAVAISADGSRAISGSDDRTCILWDLTTGKMLFTLKGLFGKVTAIAITADWKRAVSGYNDSSCIVWDLTNGRQLHMLFGHTGIITSISISADSKRIITGSYDKTCIIWEMTSGNAIMRLKKHTSIVNSVAISANGNLAISGSEDTTCIIWDLTSGRSLKTMREHSSGVNAVAITADGKLAISRGEDKTFILRDLSGGKVKHSFGDETDVHRVFAITPDGSQVTYSTIEKVCFIRFLPGVQAKKAFMILPDMVNSISFTPDMKRALVNSGKNCILWDLKTGQILRVLTGHKKNVSSVAITPDGKRAISGSWDNTCIFWDLTTGKVIHILEGHTNSVISVALTPDGKRAISGSADKTCILWNLEYGNALYIFKGHTDKVTYVAITPDGSVVFTSSDDLSIMFWNLITGEELETWHCFFNCRYSEYDVGISIGTSNVNAITPDGKRAISCTDENTLMLWDLKNGNALFILKGHTSTVNAVAITADGKRAISGSEDKTCILWDLDKGKKIKVYTNTAGIQALAFCPGGALLVTYSGEIIILDIDKKLLQPGIAITTIRKIWNHELKYSQEPTVDCPYCHHRFEPNGSVLKIIEEINNSHCLLPDYPPCLNLPQEIWMDPELSGTCPSCGKKLKFNPFIAKVEDYDDYNYGFSDLDESE